MFNIINSLKPIRMFTKILNVSTVHAKIQNFDIRYRTGKLPICYGIVRMVYYAFLYQGSCRPLFLTLYPSTTKKQTVWVFTEQNRVVLLSLDLSGPVPLPNQQIDLIPHRFGMIYPKSSSLGLFCSPQLRPFFLKARILVFKRGRNPTKRNIVNNT